MHPHPPMARAAGADVVGDGAARQRANRNGSAALGSDAVEQVDAELAPDPFTVLHGNSAYFLVPK